MIIIHSFVIFLCLSIPPIEIGNEVKFELIEEKQYDKEIWDVKFGETKDGRLYPKFVVFEGEIRVYDEEGNLISKVPYPYERGDIIYSKKGNFIGLRIPKFPEGKAPYNIKFIVYSERGENLLVINEKIEFDVSMPNFYISSKDGSVIELYMGLPKLAFRDVNGKLQKKVRLFKDDRYDITRGATCNFSEDGNYFVTLSHENVPIPFREDRPARDGNPYVILFNREGEEMWRYPLEEQGFGPHVSISPGGCFVVANNTSLHETKRIVASGTYLLSKEGALIRKYNNLVTPGGVWDPHIAFSRDEEFAALANLRKVIFVQTSTGEVLWEHEIELDEIIRDISISGNNVTVMIEVKSVEYPSKILFLDINRESIGEKLFTPNTKQPPIS